MLWTVIRVELRNLGRERLPWIAIAVFAVLVGYATAGGWAFSTGESGALTRLVEEDAQRREKLRAATSATLAGAAVIHAADPRDPLAVGEKLAPRVAVLPPGPLSVVAVGQRDVLPQAVTLTVAARSTDLSRDDGSSPGRRANGPFDLSFVVVLLLPLLVLALSYDLLAGEREQGTLALVLSQPVSLRTFVLGKALARAGVVVAVVLGLCLLGPLAHGGWLTPGGATRLALYAAVLVAYTALWFLLALAVDAWGRSSATNALSLVGVWLGLAVVVPGLASAAVDTLYPSPSRVELVNLARAAARSAEARESDLEGDHGKARPGAQALGRRTIAIQEELTREMAPVLARFDAQRARRQSLVDRLRFVSPAIVVSEALADLAGSNVGRHHAFLRQVSAFHAELCRFFFDRIRRGVALAPSDYDEMPAFRFQEAPDSGLVARLLASLAGLVAPAAGALAIALAGLRRQEIRGFR